MHVYILKRGLQIDLVINVYLKYSNNGKIIRKKYLWLAIGYKEQRKKPHYFEYTFFVAITNYIENKIK